MVLFSGPPRLSSAKIQTCVLRLVILCQKLEIHAYSHKACSSSNSSDLSILRLLLYLYDLKTEALCLFFSHQVTADGSINCANQPDEQESVVGQLIFCEAVAAINLLCHGGNFVFKMFTALEHQMVSLMYLLSCVFQEIQVIKPGKTSYSS